MQKSKEILDLLSFFCIFFTTYNGFLLIILKIKINKTFEKYNVNTTIENLKYD